MYDIIFVQLRLNIVEGGITKSGQPDLSESVVGNCITSKGRKTNLVC